MLTYVLLALLGTSATTDAGPSSSSVEGSSGWREDPSLFLAGAVSRTSGEPVFPVLEDGWCVDMGRRPAEPGKPTTWDWAWCPASTEPASAPRPCQTLEVSGPDRLSILAENCPGHAVAFAELELATCGQGNLEKLLRGPFTHTLHIPKDHDAIAPLRPKMGHGPFPGEKVGCATSVTSPDGRVRAWTLKTAVRHEGPYRADNAERGQAYLQWLTPEGDLELVPDGAWEDLSLDAALDGIIPMPDNPQEYLVTGYRYRGFDLLRFAEVISLAGEHPKLSRGRFLVGNQKEDVLLVSGDSPETGKPRHSPVYNHWIRLKGKRLWIEPIPGASCCSPPTKPFVLAEWTGGVFKTTKGGWAQLRTHQDLYK
jgi:hypothetical protein